MFNKIAKNFFYLEAYINFASGLAMIAQPMSVTESLLGSTNEDENTLEMIRWFGVMVFAFGFYLLHQTLNRNQWDQTKVVFQSFLIGDVAFTFNAARWSVEHEIYNYGAIFNILFSLSLGVFRIFALSNPKYHGFLNDDKGKKKD